MQEKKQREKIIKTFISHSINDTEKFASFLAKNAKPNDVFCLEGELGVGKTVVAKGIGKFFNVSDSITSPTFTLLKTYDVDNNKIKKIYHFDLYRIKSIEELYNIGFEEYLYDENAISIIEWPEIALDIIENKIKIIKISKEDDINCNSENYRTITYEER